MKTPLFFLSSKSLIVSALFLMAGTGINSLMVQTNQPIAKPGTAATPAVATKPATTGIAGRPAPGTSDERSVGKV